jgi:hypothetical protein
LVDTYPVNTYAVPVNVTLSIDDEIVTRARDLANRRGTSLNQMIRDYLEELASDLSPEEILVELNALWSASVGDSGGQRWKREELHERTSVR